MKKIETIHAFICDTTDQDGYCEGIPCAMVHGTWYPLISADQARLNSVREKAQDIANRTGQKIRLVRFVKTEIVEVLTPEVTQ